MPCFERMKTSEAIKMKIKNCPTVHSCKNGDACQRLLKRLEGKKVPGKAIWHPKLRKRMEKETSTQQQINSESNLIE